MTLKVFIEGKALADVVSAATDLKQVWVGVEGTRSQKLSGRLAASKCSFILSKPWTVNMCGNEF